MIITIQGTAGSGKGTIARILAEKLSYDYYSVGDFRRKRAKELGMTLEQYNTLGETDSSTDKDADEWQKNLGLTKSNFIIDGRTGFLFIPHSLKIFLYTDAEVAAQRIYDDMLKNSSLRINQQHASSFQEQMQLNMSRDASDAVRYKKWYGLENIRDPKHYDLFIDTSHMTILEVTTKILNYIEMHNLTR